MSTLILEESKAPADGNNDEVARPFVAARDSINSQVTAATMMMGSTDNRLVSSRITLEEESISVEELASENNRAKITEELMKKKSPNRIGTKYQDAFV